ncbi:hypothetical protein IFM47457_08215 [Aspergillus lentulus]|nr:hypothetical protein IFM47457_08215 [Aspergillus lentulus]
MPDGNGAPARVMWQKIIPQLAFDSELVLNPMLALSALHFHAHSPNDPIMGISLRRYLDRTIKNHRQALSHPRHEISEQLWLSAIILANVYWLLAHERRPAETYALPFQAWSMIQGISILYSQNKALLNRLGYSWFEHAWLGYEIQPLIVAGDKLPVAAKAQLQSVKEDLEHLLIEFRVAAQAQGNKEIYLEAKDYVLYYYRAFYSGAAAETLRQFIATMAVRCQPGYIAMLGRHDPLAMALMARILVLLCGLEPAWWINGKGDYEVLKRDIQGICALMPAESHWVMDWPCGVLNGEIILSRLP